MRWNFRRLHCILLLACLSVGIFGCAQGRRKLVGGVEAKNARCEPGKQGGTLRLALGLGPLTFNPFVSSSPDTLEVTRKLFGTLLDYDFEKRTPEDSGLAATVSVESDGAAYAVQLRNCQFSDGTPITADDVAFSYAQALNPQLDSPLGDLLRIGEQGVKVAVSGPAAAVIRFPAPVSPDLARLILARIPIVSKASYEAAGGGRDAYGIKTDPTRIACSGPFTVKSVSAAELTLEANPKYWKVDSAGTLLPYADQVKYVLNVDRAAQSDQFAAGRIDAVNALTPEAGQRLKGDGKVVVKDVGGSLRVWALALNGRTDTAKISRNRSKHFFDPNFRIALSHLINRDRLTAAAGGAARPAYNVVSPGNATWFDEGAKRYAYNLEEAKADFAESKYQYAPGKDLLDALNQPVRFTLTYPKNPMAERLAKEISDSLGAAGIVAKPTGEDAPQWWKLLNLGVYDMILVEIQPDFPDPLFLKPFVAGSRVLFAEKTVAPDFDIRKGEWYNQVVKAFDEALTRKSVAERKELYGLIQKKWGEQAPMVYLMSENIIAGAQTRLGNVRMAGFDPSVTWNLEELYVK
jgi:peptide/nickel transport system substrate-binding protein